ncbi:hypothetical protein RchiOBHm_Chr5g0061721 [Rosa chinensis]|uniref:Uncharacterized protein n=1 Tax=Rosa chinensis TaxID=74649 RepID=A0A2P6QI05_ROSCH|nr:hypothetical protein RchiOBHm_Chr5g0061721 [Rosa chinensis]
MENPNTISKNHKRSLYLPRRGQVKIKIFKCLFKSLASMLGAFARKPDGEDGGFLSSNSQTPAETPSGYCSDAQSDRS